MTPRLWIAGLTFSDNSAVSFDKSDVVIIVGPNNSGKSATLRSIRDKIATGAPSVVIKDLQVGKEGSAADVVGWLRTFAKVAHEPQNPHFQGFGTSLPVGQVPHWWNTSRDGFQALARFFCHMLTADERLATSVPAGNIAVLHEPPVHPLHFLLRDEQLEERLSKQFRKAFGMDLIVNRLAGSQIPVHVGQRPVPDRDRLSPQYISDLEKLPQLHTQGDGMRSFAGVLLQTSVGRESIVLVDEPEAFLHPPQARQLGRMLASQPAEPSQGSETSEGAEASQLPAPRQLFIATHSSDVLRGMLDAGRSVVRVIRMTREGDVNHISRLDNDKVVELWSDPLLRSSNILDGLFHERVILCESDADARFYSAVADAVVEASGPDARRPDVMFTHCGGKDRLAVVLRALRGVDVPVSVAADFDILSSEQPLRSVVEGARGDWNAIRPNWTLIKTAIDSKKPELNSAEVARDIKQILDGVTDTIFPKQAKDGIQEVFRRSSPWAAAKAGGKAFVPSGDPTRAYQALLSDLTRLGIHVVEVGELEGFVRSVGNHGPKWVNEVLKKNLAQDIELEDARKFVIALLP